MRTYGQYCAVARALDVVGDRWTLLVVRELLGRGPLRYTDLRSGLPGIATNMLADRLRELERSGVVERYDAPPPAPAALFRLTERGAELQSVITALGRWGVPLMGEAAEGDAFRAQWLRFPVLTFLADHQPHAPTADIELRAAGEVAAVRVERGQVTFSVGARFEADAVVEAEPPALMRFLAGAIPLDDAKRKGISISGDRSVLRRVLPTAVPDVELA